MKEEELGKLGNLELEEIILDVNKELFKREKKRRIDIKEEELEGLRSLKMEDLSKNFDDEFDRYLNR